jgi:uncharacterized protein YggL (DUF469 family)
MGACRESTKMERALDRFMSQLRSVDKVLWHYGGKNIEKEPFPLSSFEWLDEELNDAHRLWMELLEERNNERRRVIELNNKLYTPNQQEQINKAIAP